jgi:hypothetical protein
MTKRSGTTRDYLHGYGFRRSHDDDTLQEKARQRRYSEKKSDKKSDDHRSVDSVFRDMLDLLFSLFNTDFEVVVLLEDVLKTLHLLHNKYIK